jgi:hypothetical protein
MLVNLRRTGALALLAAGAVVLAGSCANEDTSIFIRGCLDVPRDTCSADAATTSAMLLEGAIDGAYAGEYRCFALVENQMVQQGDPNTLKTETDGVQLYEAEVQVLNTGGEVITYGNTTAQFSVPISGWVDPATSGQPGVGISLVTLIDGATMQALGKAVTSTKVQQEVVVSVVIKGRTLGGFEVHTNEFLYPIQVGYANSCSVPTGQQCVPPAGMASTTATGDCLLGQDELSGTNCQLIASNIGFCKLLECPTIAGTTFSDLSNAHCPSHNPPDDSCCNPAP